MAKTQKTRIAIACQGGGTHTAFTAGVLKKLLAEGVHQTHDLVGLSGTSGGAVCAAGSWYGLLKTANGASEPAYKWMVEFWQANAANSLWERTYDTVTGAGARLAQQGIVPSFPANPYQTDWMVDFLEEVAPRREFFDFKLLLEQHLDFEEMRTLVKPDSPRLFIGAVDVLSGHFKVFDSIEPSEIRVEALLASAGIPSLFRAVEIDGAAYWDGLFSQNPPVTNFIKLERTRRPDEIWVVLINPLACKSIPRTAQAIVDRRNELAGNLSLYQEIRFIERVNSWLEMGVLKEELAAQMKPVKIRIIKMSEAVADRLGYASKLTRDADFIDSLLQEGERQAAAFLREREGDG